jgi:hypothetical protein
MLIFDVSVTRNGYLGNVALRVRNGSIAAKRPPASIEVYPGINLVKRQVDAKFRQANWSGRVGAVPVPRLLTRFAPERTK